jgi:muscleblind protein
VEVQNGRVTCCFDSIKGKCQRKDPPCKYLHPPQHLKEQLLQNGRNNLILRQLQMQALTQALPMAPMYPMMSYETSAGAVQPASTKASALASFPSAAASGMLAASPGGHYQHLMAQPSFMVPNAGGFSPYVPMLNSIHGMLPGTLDGSGAGVPVSAAAAGASLGTAQGLVTMAPQAPKLSRVDRLEPNTSSASNGGEGWIPGGSPAASDAPPTTQCSPLYFQPQPPVVEVLNAVQGKKRARDPSDDLLLGTVPGSMVPMVKRSAVADSKSGMPIGYPAAQQTSSYQQALAAMQLQQQQPFVPVTITGHTPGVPRF